MKRGSVALFLVLILFFSIISVNFVSAGLFGDVWSKITGRVTEENVTPEPEPEPPPEPPVECIKAGEETWAGDPNCCEGLKAVSDCLPNQDCPISLRYCVDCGNGRCEAHENWYNCLIDCEEEKPPEPRPEEKICCKIATRLICDGYPCPPPEVSYEFRLEGECVLIPAPGADESYEIVDNGYCEAPPPPPPGGECEEGEMKYYNCEDGTKIPWCRCGNGVWICKVSIKDDCPQYHEPETCAARIQVTFNKDLYSIGDPFKIIIETFDLQGNHLPNYAFYAAMYDDRWHTPGLEKTDSKGYFIHAGTAEKPGGGVTEVQFRVYTKETSSCGSVEDTASIKLELADCGIGGCAPRPECKDKVRMCGGVCPPCPEDDENGEIFYPCRGCDVDGKCYPLGYRKEARYCSDNYEFVTQREEGACDNSFECKSNVCVSGECVGEGLIKRIMAWFRKMFGGGRDDREPKDCSKLLIEKDIGDYEYVESGYGENEHSQVPVYSEDGENIGTIKCCMADYSEAATMVCAFDSKQDVKNSLRWVLATGKGTEGFSLKEFKGEKVLANGMIVWTSNAYLIASGGKPGAGNRFVEDIAEAYLKKYKSDLGDIDIPYIEPKPEPKSCEEIINSEEQAGCYIDLAIRTNDASICEKIVYESRYRNKCYVNIAEHRGDGSICENVDDSSLREKCYFWAAGEAGDVDGCGGIVDINLQAICYAEVAEKKGDSSFCDKIVDSHIGDKCYRDVGIQTNNKGLCESIIDDGVRQKCFDNTS